MLDPVLILLFDSQYRLYNPKMCGIAARAKPAAFRFVLSEHIGLPTTTRLDHDDNTEFEAFQTVAT